VVVASLDPYRVQVYVDADCADSGEFSRLVMDATRSLANAFTALTGDDPLVGRSADLEWSAGSSHGRPRHSRRNQNAETQLPRLAESLDRHESDVHLSWHNAPEVEDRLSATVSASSRGGLDPASLNLQLLWSWLPAADVFNRAEDLVYEVLRGLIGKYEVRFGNVTDDNSPPLGVALDRACACSPLMVRERWETDLRSYAWITYVAQHHIDCLGGLDPLRRSGAFSATEQVSGGALLRATPHLRDYVGPRVRAVRDVLSPVLFQAPTRARRDGLTQGLRVSWDDGTNGPSGPMSNSIIGKSQAQFEKPHGR
jgi:hypothetical protein